MISKIITRPLSRIISIIKPSTSLLLKPVFFKSKMSIQQIRNVIEVQIKAQQSNSKDIQQTRKWFNNQGWNVSHDRTLVQLSKETQDYQIKLLSNVKSPQFQNQLGDQQKEQKQNVDVNQVAICMTKKGKPKTMVVYVVVSQTFQITAINFVQNIDAARQQRLNFHNNYNYKGPVIQTIPQQLFNQLNNFIKQQLTVNTQLLQRMIDYCIQSQQSFYIGWLKDLNRSF